MFGCFATLELDFVDSNDTERELADMKTEFALLLQKFTEGINVMHAVKLLEGKVMSTL